MPAVQRIDHINIVTDAPGPLAAELGQRLDLPVSSPLVSLPTFDLAVLAAGNATIEVQRFGWRRRTPEVATRAEFAALVFDTDDLDATLAELTRTGVPHIAPLVFSGPDTRLHSYDEYRRSPDDPNWRVSVIDGVLSEDLISKRLSARPLAGSGPGALRMGRIMGRVASAKNLGRLGAPIFAPGSSFLAVCEWGHDKQARRADDRERLEATGDGVGIRGVREVTAESPDVVAARKRWQRLLGPPDRDDGGWTLDGGPALRLIEGPRDQLASLTLEVNSLSDARDRLAVEGLIPADAPDEPALSPTLAGGLEIHIVEETA